MNEEDPNEEEKEDSNEEDSNKMENYDYPDNDQYITIKILLKCSKSF